MRSSEEFQAERRDVMMLFAQFLRQPDLRNIRELKSICSQGVSVAEELKTELSEKTNVSPSETSMKEQIVAELNQLILIFEQYSELIKNLNLPEVDVQGKGLYKLYADYISALETAASGRDNESNRKKKAMEFKNTLRVLLEKRSIVAKYLKELAAQYAELTKIKEIVSRFQKKLEKLTDLEIRFLNMIANLCVNFYHLKKTVDYYKQNRYEKKSIYFTACGIIELMSSVLVAVRTLYSERFKNASVTELVNNLDLIAKLFDGKLKVVMLNSVPPEFSSTYKSIDDFHEFALTQMIRVLQPHMDGIGDKVQDLFDKAGIKWDRPRDEGHYGLGSK